MAARFRRSFALVFFAWGLIASSPLVRAQAKDAKAPETPPRNAKKGDFAVFPLGAIGADAEVLAGQRSLTILKVLPKSAAARAGLRAGDRVDAIVKDGGAAVFPVHSRKLMEGGRGPMRSLGVAIDESLRSGERRLTLRVTRRDEQDLKVFNAALTLPEHGAFAQKFEAKCAESRAFYDGVCRDLLATQRKNGSWRSRTGKDADRYVSALCGLALLGRGDAGDRPALERLANYLAGPAGRGYVSADFKTPAGLSNWFICASGIFLAEYAFATGEDKWRPTIQHLVDCMVERQAEDGRYGHGLTSGYGGKGFNIINAHAHLLWALAARVGCKVDASAWQRSFAEIKKSTGPNGGVRYWTRQTGYWDACARTGLMALALDLDQRAPALCRRMASYLDRFSPRMREAHAMGSIGMIFGTAALRRVDSAAWGRHMETWRWYLALARLPDRSAGYIGGKRNNGGDHYLRKEHVANAIVGMMLATGAKKLQICGNDERAWLAEQK